MSCKNCTVRQIGCHAEFESYRAYREERDRVNQIKKINNQINYDIIQIFKPRRIRKNGYFK